MTFNCPCQGLLPVLRTAVAILKMSCKGAVANTKQDQRQHWPGPAVQWRPQKDMSSWFEASLMSYVSACIEDALADSRQCHAAGVQDVELSRRPVVSSPVLSTLPCLRPQDHCCMLQNGRSVGLRDTAVPILPACKAQIIFSREHGRQQAMCMGAFSTLDYT